MIRKLSIISVVLVITIYITGCGSTNVAGNRGIEGLGTLGGEQSTGAAINNDGTVTGNSVLTGDLVSGRLHAFRYVDGPAMIDIGTLLPGAGNFSFGEGINNRGVICGGATGLEGRFHAYIAGPGPGLTDLAPDLIYSRAYDINDNEQVTGSADFGPEAPFGTETNRAFLWTRADGLKDIGTLGGRFSSGRSINANGQIAGISYVGAATNQIAFRYTPGVGMINLGTLGGRESIADGINDSGQVVRTSETGEVVRDTRAFKSVATERLFHAFLWTEGVGMIDLGDLSGSITNFGGSSSGALDINNGGVVVGFSSVFTREGITSHAFRWTREGGMVDLNTLLPSGSGWVLNSASGINDKGAITGTGIHNGVVRAYRLNHVPPAIAAPVVNP